MKREVMTAWVTALRSKKFEQTTHRLQRTEEFKDGKPLGYCCLGVLCEIAPPELVKRTPTGRLMGYDLGDQRAVLDWAGFKPGNHTGHLGDQGPVTSLVSLNDGANADPMTFEQLAGVIERNWELL